MDFLHSLLVLVHLFGAAVIIGTWIATFKTPTVTTWQFAASIAMLLSGLLLLTLAELNPEVTVNHMKIGIKLLLAIGVFVAAFIGWRKQRRGDPVSKGLAHGTGGTALIAMIVATLV
ncbi:hypothetical protein GWK18_02010 [Kocuria sp. JC486]|uniref:Fe-S protein n=2 Tax=Kocuria TaxID=57493 RepID=A0A3N3ZRM0_9MICC|nr:MULTISPECIES: hypothetical protein [Kocuria]NHU84383.1 hypothetical protein [Kocuria sp. JC486]NKE10982.1 hypothetical protein [Kocuria subflava]ROZ63967.1 hypothetical protein EDL96_04070 [Kocuria soli]